MPPETAGPPGQDRITDTAALRTCRCKGGCEKALCRLCLGKCEAVPIPAVDWERIAREAVLHVIRHREDFHHASHRPCGTCDRSAAFLANLPEGVARTYRDSSCTSMNRTGHVI